MYHIGEKFILKLDKKLKDVMLIAQLGVGLTFVYLLDLDSGHFITEGRGFKKGSLGENKGRLYLTEKQMSIFVDDPKENLLSVGAGFPDVVVQIEPDGEINLETTEAVQVFFIDNINNTKRRVFVPAYLDSVGQTQKKIEQYWEENWE